MVTAMSGEKSSQPEDGPGAGGEPQAPKQQPQQQQRGSQSGPRLPPSLAFTAHAHPATHIMPAAQDSPNYLTYKKASPCHPILFRLGAYPTAEEGFADVD